MAESRKYSDKINRSRFENNQNLTAAEKLVQQEFDDAGGTGYYQKTNLEDIVNNFLATQVGADKVLKSVPRHEVEFWGQRFVSEMSYDVFYSEKAEEFEIDDKLAFPLPGDYVNYVKASWTDSRGQERRAHPARRTTAAQGILQDDNFKFLYDNNGEKLSANISETLTRFQDVNSQLGSGSNASDFYYGNFDEDNYSYYYNIYFGRRYGLDPQYSNTNGTFVIDTYKGMVYLDPSFLNSGVNDATIFTFRYISDGLQNNDDLSKVYVHKFGEDAAYKYLLYNLTKVRPSTVSLSALYKKETEVAIRKTKIRLMNLKSEEMTQVFRGMAKWIKH